MVDCLMFDWDRLRAVVQGDEALLRELLEVFLQEANGTIAAIRSAIDRAEQFDDREPLRIAAHTLVGSMRLLGTETHHRLALQLEERAKSGDLDAARALADQLGAGVADLCGEFRKYLSN